MSGISSVYPAPPWYYNLFTPENLAKLKQAQSIKDPEEREKALADPSLEYLQPPKTLQQGGYSNFGSIWQVNDKLMPLSEAGVEQLYNELDKSDESVQANHQSRVWELKKLLKSLLVNFLELVKIMGVNPEKFPAKTEDIRVILINMHHLLNEYRPHQSRESLVLLMEEQIQKTKQEIETIREGNKNVYKEITNLASQFSAVEDAGAGAGQLFGLTEPGNNLADSDGMEVDYISSRNDDDIKSSATSFSKRASEKGASKSDSQQKEDLHLWSLI